jgi:protein gp37
LTSDIWNPWHGCVKYSEGCKNCYVYRRDDSIGKDASEVKKTLAFDLPLKRARGGQFKIPPGSTIFCCMTSDFFIDQADIWREDIWDMMRQRSDVDFIIITKRILRFYECIPRDWGDGYKNVSFVCTIENQKQCDTRFPFFNTLPIRNKFIACEPLLTDIDMKAYLNPSIRQVLVGGESGKNARVCNYSWVMHIREQCIDAGVRFYFKQTGARFIKNNKLYNIERKFQCSQARKANLNT